MKTLVNDIKKLKTELGGNFESAWLFGSCLTNSDETSDIDVAVKLKQIVKLDLLKIIEKEKIGRVSLNSYGGSPKKCKSGKYDIVFLTDRNYSDYFFQRNNTLRIA